MKVLPVALSLLFAVTVLAQPDDSLGKSARCFWMVLLQTRWLPSLIVVLLLSREGEWGDLFSHKVIPIHAMLLPDGQVLMYGTDNNGKQGGAVSWKGEYQIVLIDICSLTSCSVIAAALLRSLGPSHRGTSPCRQSQAPDARDGTCMLRREPKIYTDARSLSPLVYLLCIFRTSISFAPPAASMLLPVTTSSLGVTLVVTVTTTIVASKMCWNSTRKHTRFESILWAV